LDDASPPISHARLGTLSGDPESLRLVQARVALFAATVGGLSLFFYAFIGAALLIDPKASASDALVGPGRLEHLAGTLIALGIALLTHRLRQPTIRKLGQLDALATIAPIYAWAAMILAFGTVQGAPSGWLAVSFAVIGRAITVPSTVARTARISAVALIAQPIVASLLALRDRVVGVDDLPTPPSTAGIIQFIVESALWALAAGAIATYASRVIYGLREQVREARRLGQYVLIRKLGEGGMGEVFLAHHSLLRRPTAIKLIRPGSGSKDRVARFEREVQRTAELTHPNTIAVYDYGHTRDGVFYYAMEYLEGVDLQKLAETAGALPPGRALHLLDQLCASLTEAHEKGLVHRDVKPANLILCKRGGAYDTLKVVDFGLVKDSTRTEGIAATQGDRVIGTPHYIAPEAVTAPTEVDARSDLYAVGAVAYFLLTGQDVFPGATMVEVLTRHLHDTAPSVASRLGRPLDDDLEAVVAACLAKDPVNRPRSARELRRRIRLCKDFGTWTEEDARAWWAEHGPGTLAGEGTKSVSEDSRTLGIDIAERERLQAGLKSTLPAGLDPIFRASGPPT
jgi:serine/threonine-protein kinase